MKFHSLFIAFVVSLGGFLFGFDMGIISGVMDYVGPQLSLDENQTGWVVSCPTFAAMFAMLAAGAVSNLCGRKPLLLAISVLYAASAFWSAYAETYVMLYLARMLGGVAFGAALIIAPTYIAEISKASNRGKLVSIQQLNIVIGFFAAFLCNWYLNLSFKAGVDWLTEENVWRWMLGIEVVPAVLYFFFLLLVPSSPRWLFTRGRTAEGHAILQQLHGQEEGDAEAKAIKDSIEAQAGVVQSGYVELFNPKLGFVLLVGLAIGILQQSTGINAVFFYAVSIFKQTGIGQDAAFASGLLLSTVNLLFTFVGIFLIDRLGRRPLLLIGIAGIAVSLMLCAFAFYQATYELTDDGIATLGETGDLSPQDLVTLASQANQSFENDVDFKQKMKDSLGKEVYDSNEGVILEVATKMNAKLVLAGILGFIACFAFSLGPVMWVMLSELYPNGIRGLAIGVIGFVNSCTAWFVSYIFPWEVSNFGNAMSFLIFGLIAALGFFLLLFILPETKGRSLEELEAELVQKR
ncbi:MFS transporter [bacterium]|nr:MFS transporter [bacterium]